MANWLTSAANVFQRAPAAEPQTYELRCSCGRTVGGVRATTYQQITCPACRQRLFVLPASVYPTPKPAKTRPPKPAAKPTAPAAGSAERETPVEERPVQPARRKPAIPATPRPRRLVTPVRIALVAVACATLVTVWGVSRSRSLQQAEVDFSEAVRLGREALANRDLPGAAAQFETARKAADLLGRDDPAARSARQLARETHSAVNLLQDSPTEVLAEAVQTHAGGESAWRETFRFRYHGGWLIVDSTTLPVSTGTAQVFEFPVFAKGGEVKGQLVVDADFLRSATYAAGTKRMILAGQLEELSPVTGGPPTWTFTLNPKTAFLWSNPDTYEQALGIPLDAPTRATLSDQTTVLNLPAWQPEAAE
jgi:hypothetical protein